MDISPLTTYLGAEIAGVDLRHLNADLIQEIENVLHQYSAVFFRDQTELSPAELTDLASAFGPVFHHPAVRVFGIQSSGNNPRGSDFPGIINLEVGPEASNPIYTEKPEENKWHSDVTCDKEPPYLSILHMHEVPPVGGDTVFSSTYAAYEALSPRMKQMLDGLTARHDGARTYHLLRGVSDVPEYRDGHTEAVHPVVIRHHGSGRPALFVNREFTAELNDLPQGESEALLKFLFDHTEKADFQCRFRWSPNAVAIWDNHGIVHKATFDHWPQVRTGLLSGICGPAPKMWRLEEAPSTYDGR